jgi:hypothetical protein
MYGLNNIQPNMYFSPEIKTPIDAFYFSVVSITTLGFGDINPTSQIMRLVVSIEVLLGIITIGQALNAMTVRAEEKRRQPHRFAAYEDVRFLTLRLVQFWTDIYVASIPDKLPNTIDEVLSETVIDKMYASLDMAGAPNITPPITWYSWLPQQQNVMTLLAEKILDRHVQVLDPMAYSHIHSLLSHGMLTLHSANLINTIRTLDKQSGFPRPTNLGNYIMEDQETLSPIIKLQEWCLKEFNELERMEINTSIFPPYEITQIEYTPKTPQTPKTPKSFLSPEKLRDQFIAEEQYRNQS